LQVELTSHCNLKCRMCPLTTGSTLSSAQQGPMGNLVWAEVVRAARLAGEVLATGFGESLTSKETLHRLRELDALGVRIAITTNGTAATPAIAAELAALRNLVHVNVSIDSPDPATYRAIRGGELERALRGTANLAAALAGSNRLTVSSVLMASSLASLVEFPALLAAMGVRTWHLQSYIDYSTDDGEPGLTRLAGAAGLLDEIRAACDAAGVHLDCALPERLQLELRDPARAKDQYGTLIAAAGATRQCALPWELPYVDKDGRVFPCCFAASTPSAVLGDLREKPLEEIWRGDDYARFRERLVHAVDIPPVCRGCSVTPLGPHPFAHYGASIVHDECELHDARRLKLVVRNTGSVAWTRASPVNIGTAAPRGGHSYLHHASWFDPTRVARCREDTVAPGDLATYTFQVTDGPRERPGRFQLVAEGVAWLPGTTFTMRPEYYGAYRATPEEGIDFAGRDGYPDFVRRVEGLSHFEPGGRWTEGAEVRIRFAQALPTRFRMRIDTVNALGANATLPVIVRAGSWSGSMICAAERRSAQFTVSTEAPADTVILTIPEPRSPRERGMGPDDRLLGLRLMHLSVAADRIRP
jgi:radical SAM protein with 4Fe4S-binding SPASM domain